MTVAQVAAPERPQTSRSDEELGAELKAKFQSFESYPAPVYGTNNLGCSEEEWKFRVDLAAAYRLACRFGFNEGIVNHFTVLPIQAAGTLCNGCGTMIRCIATCHQ